MSSITNIIDKTKNGKAQKYQIGEQVLAEWNSKKFKAKIINFNQKSGEYKIHYLNYKKTWDEIVKSDKLEKYIKEKNGIKEKTIKKKSTPKAKKPLKKLIKKEKITKKPLKKEKTWYEYTISFTGKELIFDLPKNLFINEFLDSNLMLLAEKEKKMYKIPVVKRVNVISILKGFLESKNTKKGGNPKNINDFIEIIKEYFDKFFKDFVLYKIEIPYFKRLSDTTPSTKYGVIHLCRFILKLPYLMSNKINKVEHVKLISDNLIDLAKYVEKIQSMKKYKVKYVNASIGDNLKK